MPQIKMIKTSPRIRSAIYFCGGFDIKLLYNLETALTVFSNECNII
jgi:hypothetical protein